MVAQTQDELANDIAFQLYRLVETYRIFLARDEIPPRQPRGNPYNRARGSPVRAFNKVLRVFEEKFGITWQESMRSIPTAPRTLPHPAEPPQTS